MKFFQSIILISIFLLSACASSTSNVEQICYKDGEVAFKQVIESTAKGGVFTGYQSNTKSKVIYRADWLKPGEEYALDCTTNVAVN